MGNNHVAVSRNLILSGGAFALLLVTAAGHQESGKVMTPAKLGLLEVARPFFQQHCLGCHGEKSARAGFRIDLLTADFAKPKVRNNGKKSLTASMPGRCRQKGNLGPKAQQAAVLVAWVDAELREVEHAAKNAGGRIPMRRLNRDEYANTVRDLLKLDELIVRPLTEELPGDGKAEGFDRLGVALFFDQTQIERSLSVAEQIAAHHRDRTAQNKENR